MTDRGRDAIIAVADPVAATHARARPEPEVLDAILDRVAAGQSVASACVDEVFCERTFWRRVRKDERLRAEYEVVLRARALLHADEVVAILDAPPQMVETEGGWHIDSAWVVYQKNRAEGRKWNASRMLPRLYGDRIEVDAKMQVVPALDLSLSGPTPRIIDVEAPDDGATDTGGAHPSRALRSEGA